MAQRRNFSFRETVGIQIWRDPVRIDDSPGHEERSRATISYLDEQGFQYLITFVCAIGFMTDAYNIFAINTVKPILGYVYWGGSIPRRFDVWMSSSTLLGTLVGQLLFGFLADLYGRRKLYGVELIITIAATMGVLMCSTGANGSMKVEGWFIVWRAIMGLGIGADYPLSAVICSEFSPRRHRGRMMAVVFFMQPVGQLLATLVSLGFTTHYKHLIPDATIDKCGPDCIRSLDVIWRWIIGLGAIPAAIALVFRLTIPESTRYTLDVMKNAEHAQIDLQFFSGTLAPTELPTLHQNNTLSPVEQGNNALAARQAPETQQSFADFRRHFITEGHWTTLAGTSLCWFLLDLTFYGLNVNSPRTIAKVWDARHVSNGFVYSSLRDNATHSLVVVSIGAVLGGMIMILAARRVSRWRIQLTMFGCLTVLFVVIGSAMKRVTTGTAFGGALIPLYILCQLAFNFGPNTTTFIIPAELFPTRYRATCHGISAASGKLGSVISQIFLAYITFDGRGYSDPQANWFGYVLLVFSSFMALGAWITYIWVPKTQDDTGLSLSLEDLAIKRGLSFWRSYPWRLFVKNEEVEEIVSYPVE